MRRTHALLALSGLAALVAFAWWLSGRWLARPDPVPPPARVERPPPSPPPTPPSPTRSR